VYAAFDSYDFVKVIACLLALCFPTMMIFFKSAGLFSRNFAFSQGLVQGRNRTRWQPGLDFEFDVSFITSMVEPHRTEGFQRVAPQHRQSNALSGGITAKWLIADDSVFWIEESAPALSGAGQARVYADFPSHTLWR
jgi:hypothetical protein